MACKGDIFYIVCGRNYDDCIEPVIFPDKQELDDCYNADEFRVDDMVALQVEVREVLVPKRVCKERTIKVRTVEFE